MRILFVTPYFEETGVAGMSTIHCASHYRLQLAQIALAEFGGHETAIVPYSEIAPSGQIVGRSFEGEVFEDAEIVVLQGSSPIATVRHAQRGGQAVVIDVTDAAPEVPTSHPTYGNSAETRRVAKAHFFEELASADAVTVSSQYLVDYVKRGGVCHAPLLRNPVYLDEWGPPENVSDGPVLGWSGTIRWRADDCSVLRPWLGEFLEKHDLRFIHAGDEREAPSFAEAANVNPERITVIPAMSFADYVQTRPLSGVDIQLIPLMDHATSKAKSCLKGLESTALGIPFVASPQDEYKWLGCGRLAGTDIANQKPKFWIAALEAMLDPAERLRMAKEAHERVAQEDIRARWQEWESVYAEVLDRRRMSTIN
jgi:hypothetical protein